jgi:hypothetical protein
MNEISDYYLPEIWGLEAKLCHTPFFRDIYNVQMFLLMTYIQISENKKNLNM